LEFSKYKNRIVKFTGIINRGQGKKEKREENAIKFNKVVK
jgi:hypothetical protein